MTGQLELENIQGIIVCMQSIQNYSNKTLAQLLRTISTALLLKADKDTFGNVRFRMMAYDKAAEKIETLGERFEQMVREGRLTKIPGIGATIGAALKELILTGHSEHFESLLEGIPPSVFTLLEVPGIGPKKAYRLVMQFQLFDVDTVVDQLALVCQQGEVAKLEGFGEKSQADILQGIDLYKKRVGKEQRILISEASKIAQMYTDYLNESPLIKRIDVLGSLRRRVSTIGDVDIAVMASDMDAIAIVDHFLKHPSIDSVAAKGDAKASIFTTDGVRVDLRVQDEQTYGTMLQYFTGSKAYNIQMREYALKKGWSLNEYGLTSLSSSSSYKVHKVIKTNAKQQKESINPDKVFSSEEKLYDFLGLQYVPPEIREGNEELEMAKKHSLPSLLALSDVKGDLHMHCSYPFPTSHDLGANTPAELAKQARQLNYKYIGITDHNPRQKGLSAKEIIHITKERKSYIDEQLRSSGIHYFIGYEVDILPTGEIALPDEAIEYVDYLIVSLHSSFTQERETATKRVLKALSHQKVKIFGHPTGRLINQREGADLDWRQIFDFVKERDIALEINSSPSRLDLPDVLVKEGKDKGVKFIVDTDAHAVGDMLGMKYGVDVARRGWLTKHEVLNTLSASDFQKWLIA